MEKMTLGSVAEYVNGLAFKPDDWEESGRPIIRIQNLTKSTNVCNRTNKIYNDKYLIHEGDLLFAWSASLGVHIWHGEDAWLNQHIFKVVPKSNMNKMFLYYYLLYVVDNLYAKAHGSGMVHITLQPFKSTPIIVPSLNTQHRIVEKIESMFSKLDEAKEKAQSVLDGFGNRRAVILHKAFTGELTKKWREKHYSFRKIVKILDICSSLKYGTANKSLKIGKVAVIRMGNLQNGEIDWTNLVYSDNEEDNKKYLLSAGDVLFNRTNSAEYVGKTSIYRGEIPAIYAGYLIKIDYDRSHIVGDYLNYLLNSPEAKKYCNHVKSDAVNQSNINAQKIGAFTIPLIGMDEQLKIVRILDKLLSQEQQAKQAAEAVITKIDVMKKSILARAFRGELGTNDPSDEPARMCT